MVLSISKYVLRKITSFLVLSLLVVIFGHFFTTTVNAESCANVDWFISSTAPQVMYYDGPDNLPSASMTIVAQFDQSKLPDGTEVKLIWRRLTGEILATRNISNGKAEFVFTYNDDKQFFDLKYTNNNPLIPDLMLNDQTRKIELLHNNGLGGGCELQSIKFTDPIACTTAAFSQNGKANPNCIDIQSDITLSYSGIKRVSPYTGDLKIWQGELNINGHNSGSPITRQGVMQVTNGSGTATITKAELQSKLGNSHISDPIYLRLPDQDIKAIPGCTMALPALLKEQCTDEEINTPPPSVNSAPFELCNQIPDSETTAKQACRNCVADQDKVWTAVGCISKEPKDIIAQFITIGLGIGGGVALIMIIAGGFMLTISQGNPQKTNEAKEMITSAIIGLLFVIFSVVILQFIGVTIFRIPGFGEEAAP